MNDYHTHRSNFGSIVKLVLALPRFHSKVPMAYFRALCEHVDTKALTAFKKDRKVGLFYDKSMMEVKYVQQACVEHRVLLRAILEINPEPPRVELQQALDRLNAQHDNLLFDGDENSDYGSRMQSQGLRLMISFISKKSRNMKNGDRTHPDLRDLVKQYDDSRLKSGVSKYTRTPSTSPESNRAVEGGVSMDDILAAFGPRAGSSNDSAEILAAFGPPAGSSNDSAEILSSQDEEAAEAATAAHAAKPLTEKKEEHKQYTDWGLNRLMRIYPSGALLPATMSRKLGEAFLVGAVPNGDEVISEIPALEPLPNFPKTNKDEETKKRPAASSSKKRPAACQPETSAKKKPLPASLRTRKNLRRRGGRRRGGERRGG